LIEPSRCPSRANLPREQISEPNLREVLRLAIVNKAPTKLALAVKQSLGGRYLGHLLSMLSIESYNPQAFVWHDLYYIAELAKLEQVAQAHFAASRKLGEIIQAADQIHD